MAKISTVRQFVLRLNIKINNILGIFDVASDLVRFVIRLVCLFIPDCPFQQQRVSLGQSVKLGCTFP